MSIDTTKISAEQKRALLTRLLERKANTVPSLRRGESSSTTGTSNPARRELSAGERGLWLHSRLAPGSAAYTILYAARLPVLDLQRLRRALDVLAGRHRNLVTTFAALDGRPIAVAHQDATIPLDSVDAQTWHSQQLDRWLDTLANTPLDLENGPVAAVRIARMAGHDVLALTLAHIVADFWSLDVLLTELLALYDGAELPMTTTTYADFVDWQAKDAAVEQHWNYWSRQLSGELPTLDLASKRPATQTYRGATHSFPIPAQRLREVARAEGVTLQVAVLAAYTAVLHRYTGQPDILVGSPMAGRSLPGSDAVVGYFVNTVVLRSDLSDQPTYAELLQRTRRTVLDAVAHQDFPFPLLIERLVPVRDPAYPPLFQVFFAWEQTRNGVGFETVVARQGGAPVDLMLQVADDGGNLTAVLQYNIDLFDAAAIERFAGHLTTLLEHAGQEPWTPVGALRMLTANELVQQADWNNTQVEEFQGHTLHSLLDSRIARTPHATALTFQGRHVSYRELDARADSLAARVRAAGAVPGDVVGIGLPRSENSIIAALAVLRAGCAFLPVDPAHPVQRLATIAAESNATVWITDSTVRERLSASATPVLVDEPTPPTTFESVAVAPDDIAYVMFTSGSTGVPKGVPNTHRGIANRLLWMQAAYPLTSLDTVLHKTPANFDVSVWELFWALLAGARIVVAEPDGHRDSGYLAQLIVEQGVTVTHFVPSMLSAFLGDPRARECTSLRAVITSGEALTADLRDAYFATLPGTLHNLYGPTEAAIDVTYFDCVRGDSDPVVPIGKPIANTLIMLRDNYGNPVPVGVPGELHIGGIGVSHGYLHQPELTAERFVDSADGRLYRTGDLARYRSDGTIDYLGRLDHQVKIRGVRIELGEIEHAMLADPEVSAAAVTVRDERLVAYVVGSPDVVTLREMLRNQLPDSMIPTHFLTVDDIPTTANGKRDLKALPDPGRARPALTTDFRAPRTATEIRLARLWCEALRLDAVGVHDDFFELGGASTQVMSVCAAARVAGIELVPETLFRNRSIATLAAEVDAAGGFAEPAQTMPDTASVPSTSEEIAPSRALAGIVIESLGVYLPDKIVTTAEILDGCVNKVELPLEQLTGISTRRVAGNGEYTVELITAAAAKALAGSRHAAGDIDLVIVTNITHIGGPDTRMVFEPSASAHLCRNLGLDRALSFDVSNACAGMWTGISVAQSFLATGHADTALVVSGEYISHIIGTAQREITDFLDDRLACLTVGDAGAAVILERGADPAAGFLDLRLRTLSRYADLCIGKQTELPHGGAIMRTRAVEQTAVAVRKAVPFATALLDRNRWQPETVDHIVVHQTSRSSINDATATINTLLGRPVASVDNMVCNLGERANTASTTHFVALNDMVERGELASGDRVLFSITGSGQTVGGALYTFDDLPERMRTGARSGPAQVPAAVPPSVPTVRIDAVGVAHPLGNDPALAMAIRAGGQAIDESSSARDDFGLILYAGVFRDEFLVEPATATLIAEQLGINPDPVQPVDAGTLAFDVIDGATGFLKACHVAATTIEAGITTSAIVIAAEADPVDPRQISDIRHIGSALALTASHDRTGFEAFHFISHPEYLDAVQTGAPLFTRAGVHSEQRGDLDEIYLKVIPAAVDQLLRSAGRTLDDVAVVLPPQRSSAFIDGLAVVLDLTRDQFVDVADGPDLYSSSMPVAIQRCLHGGLVSDGDIGLIITVGAGLHVGCALYHF